MTRKRRRLYILLFGMAGLAVAAALTLSALRDNLVFFYSPSDIAAKPPATGRQFRLGGLVEQGSVERATAADGKTVELHFRVTDLDHAIPVVYAGLPPDLFREGQGVVANGRLGHDGQFTASELLAKHDEKYMPPEVAAALKKSGRWQEIGGQPAGAAQ